MESPLKNVYRVRRETRLPAHESCVSLLSEKHANALSVNRVLGSHAETVEPAPTYTEADGYTRSEDTLKLKLYLHEYKQIRLFGTVGMVAKLVARQFNSIRAPFGVTFRKIAPLSPDNLESRAL